MARIAIGPDEKKKLYVLGGLLAAIVVVVVVLYVPRGTSSSSGSGSDTGASTSSTPPPARPAQSDAGAPPAPSPGVDAAGASTGDTGATAGGGGTVNAASLMAVSSFRNDPFEPVPLPPPVVVATPPPPVVLNPPSVAIAPPGGFSSGLPPFGISDPSTHFGGTPPARILAGLAPPRISHVATTPMAPKIVTLSGEGGVTRSPNKRLSGVVIGDSVHALLEISQGSNNMAMGGETGAATTITRIVQPGDEVDGIRVLRIERTTEGGRPVTRMYIVENGEESYVDLRPAPQATGQASGAPGTGAPGGMRPPF